MRTAYFICVALGFTSISWAFPAQKLSIDNKIDIAKERCTPKTADEGVIYNTAFKGFNRSLEDLDQMYPAIYESADRLVNRVGYFQEDSAFISKDTFSNTGKQVVFSEELIKSITLQVEKSLNLNYVRYVFFPDMGHSHLFIPQDYYDNEMPKGKGFIATLEAGLAAPGLKILYHTAEQLNMLDEDKFVLSDRYLQWRFYTRNPVGDSQGNIEILSNYDGKGGHNTVRKLEGYKYIAGFNISANKNGCFPFQDKNGDIQYFDLSAWDIPYKQGDGDISTFVRGNSGHNNLYQVPLKRQF